MRPVGRRERLGFTAALYGVSTSESATVQPIPAKATGRHRMRISPGGRDRHSKSCSDSGVWPTGARMPQRSPAGAGRRSPPGAGPVAVAAVALRDGSAFGEPTAGERGKTACGIFKR